MPVTLRFCTGFATAMLLITIPAQATTFFGEFWDASDEIPDLAAAEALIASVAPTATFTSTMIDYPRGSDGTVFDTTSLAEYLGSDAMSLSGAGDSTLEESVFRFTGFVDLMDGTQEVTVGSDDGFRLNIGSVEVARWEGQRSFADTTILADPGSGPIAMELIYFENGGETGVEFRIDGGVATPVADPNAPNIPDPSPVPVPASLLLGMTGIGILGFAGRRRRKN